MLIKVKLTRSENLDYYGKDEIEIDIEEYLKGVVPAEVGNAALEAGKEAAATVGKVMCAEVIARPHPDIMKFVKTDPGV